MQQISQYLPADAMNACRICELENNTLHRDLAAALEMILNHKVAIQAKIKSAEERVMTSLDEVESITIPAV